MYLDIDTHTTHTHAHFFQLAWTLKEHKSLEHEVWSIGGHQEGHRAEPH